jgi:hypothetical protein
MTGLLLLLCGLVAVIGAARSTYSPCGLSMLSSITPFGERSRRHRYHVTATWFVVGAAVGGATLGAAAAGLAAAVGAVGPPRATVAGVGAFLALAGATVDGGCFGEVLPLIRRQVDDGWLAKYRPWFYGAGFGWQIGVGFATYVMTTAVGLVVLLAALTGSPAAAFGACLVFGLARGLTVFLTAGTSSPAQLRLLHARLDRAAVAVRRSVVGVECGIVVVLVLAAAGSGPKLWLSGLLVAGGGIGSAVTARLGRVAARA